jgi:hypothetical protein
MKRILLVLLLSCVSGASAEAQLDESSAVARSQAMGGVLVSLADGPAALFVNPAGIVVSPRYAMYGDYAEPDGTCGAHESRAAFAGGRGNTRGGIGWYRFGTGDGTDNLLAVGAARRLIEGTQGSFLSIGASATVGAISRDIADSGERESWWKASGDAGVILKPLPVLAFAYSISNITDVRPGPEADGESWHRAQRWGASYFWEDRIVLSCAAQLLAGRTTAHYGMSVKTAVPVELLAGFSDGNVTGGARWTGNRIDAVVAFAAEEADDVTWTVACEARLGSAAGGEAR